MHEIPGITPAVARFARIVRDRGFTVFLPELFGEVDRAPSPGYLLGSMARACIRREFRVLAANAASPICDWLRALCQQAHAELGGRGVGALGMCLTGNFALSLVVDPCVRAPVLSQPSLPFPLGTARRRGVHASAETLEAVRRRINDEDIRVLGLRFTHDPVCPNARFRQRHAELGDGFESLEIDSSPGNAHGFARTAHSVLTEELVGDDGHPTRQALDRVVEFFADELLG
jgi:dienelactone hydrolase